MPLVGPGVLGNGKRAARGSTQERQTESDFPTPAPLSLPLERHGLYNRGCRTGHRYFVRGHFDEK